VPEPSFVVWIKKSILEICVCVIFLGLGQGLGALPPRNSAFFEQDLSLSREHFDSQVPTWLLSFVAFVFPLLCTLGYDLCKKGSVFPTSLWMTLGLAQSLTAAMIITNVTKNFVGSKRPNFFDCE